MTADGGCERGVATVIDRRYSLRVTRCERRGINDRGHFRQRGVLLCETDEINRGTAGKQAGERKRAAQFSEQIDFAMRHVADAVAIKVNLRRAACPLVSHAI